MDGNEKPPYEGEPDPPASPEEAAAAEALRDALADPSRANPLADFARAAALAHAPRSLAPDEHQRLLERAMREGDARRARERTRKGRVRAVFALATGGLAMAAAAALFLRTAPSAAPVAAMAVFVVREPLVPLRSTQPLFREPFPRTGGASARIDRIAMAREADLRENRFATWGVR